MRRGYRGRANTDRANRFYRQRYQPYPPYAPPVYIPPPIEPFYPPLPQPTVTGNASLPIRKAEPRDQLTATLKMYCEDDVIDRVMNNNRVPLADEYQPDAVSDSEQEAAEQRDSTMERARVTPVIQEPPPSAGSSMTPVNRVAAPSAVKVSPPPLTHVPVVAPKKASARPQRPATATVVHMTAQQKEIQLKLAPVQSVPYEGGKSLKFAYDPIEWPKTPKQYILEWFQRQSSLRVNKQLALIDPQRAAAMSQVPKWEKIPAPALRQGLHLVTLHVTDPRTLQVLTFTPDRYWRYERPDPEHVILSFADQSRASTVKEAEHVASLLFLQYLLPQANSAKEIHEAMENMQRHQKRFKATGPQTHCTHLSSSTNLAAGPVRRKPGAVPAEKVGHERYSAVPPTPQLTVSTRAPDAAPVKQFLDTRHSANVIPKAATVNAPQPAMTSHLPHTLNNSYNGPAAYYHPMYSTSYYYQYYGHYPHHYPYPPQ